MQNTVDNNQIAEKIKSKNIDNRVQRPGFFQSKQIVAEAVHQNVQLTDSIVALGSNIFWVNNSNGYDEDHTNYLYEKIFPRAFEEDENWPVKIVDILEGKSAEINRFVDLLDNTDYSQVSVEGRKKMLQEYVDLLIDVQKYYVIAVPLTNYCENVLKKTDASLLEYAVQYKPLDVDAISSSLIQIKKANKNKQDDLIKGHIKKFGWIKTNYNIVEEYTQGDVLDEIRADTHAFKPREVVDVPNKHIVIALQVGIYLRNRMKELSQKVWFAYDNLAKQLANDLHITKEDFLQLHYREVIDSLSRGSPVLSEEQIQERHRGFIVGFLEDEEIVATGSVVDEMFEYLNASDVEGITEVVGSTASKGIVSGTVKVVANLSEIHKLEEGNILITSMTTPDFVIAMKKAGAIVTDEGGLSSHAAIVSREFKKPCVIGTKVATKVFRDGDRVEVNANDGIVKKI